MGNRRPPRRPGDRPGRGARPAGPARHNRQNVAGPSRSEPNLSPEPKPERLQKVLAHAGVGSRRACEDVILQGRVTVDGKVVRELGTRVDPERQKVAVDGQRIHVERMVYYAVSKPKGYVSTNDDPAGRPRVIDILPEIPQRVYSIGRLDEQSTGLMLLTNDGELAHRLAHPRYEVDKVYLAEVDGDPSRETLARLEQGVELEDGRTAPARARRLGPGRVELVLHEGRKHQVKRMLQAVGHPVRRLHRSRYGPLTLDGLKVGQWRELTREELALLQRQHPRVDVRHRA